MKAGVFDVRGEKGNFKGRVFGGFNRHDVIDYIESLAVERNSLARDNERLRGRIEALEERLNDASAQPQPEPEIPAAGADREEEQRQELRRAVEEARQVLRDVNAEYDSVCADIRVNASQADHELKLISVKLTGLQNSLGAAGEKLEAIGAGLADMMADDASGDSAGSDESDKSDTCDASNEDGE